MPGAVAFTDCDRVVDRHQGSGARADLRRARSARWSSATRRSPACRRAAPRPRGKFASLRGPARPSRPWPSGIGLDRDIALRRDDRGAATTPTRSPPPAPCPRWSAPRRNGLDVTAGTSIHHLTLNEMDVADYRTFFKVKPPLRSEDDRQAVVEAVRTGLIDMICSMHTPQDEESKRLPFEEAASGAVGAGDPAAGCAAPLPFGRARPADAVPRAVAEPRAAAGAAMRGASPGARPPTSCSSTPTSRSSSTASSCARNPRTRRSTAPGCRVGCWRHGWPAPPFTRQADAGIWNIPRSC